MDDFPYHQHRGNRLVPITYGLLFVGAAIAVFVFFGSNFITWLIGGGLFCMGWGPIKIGLFGSRKLVDEMTDPSTNASGVSEESKEEWRKHNRM